MNNPALMELADRLAALPKISESGRNDDGIEGVAIPGVDCYHFDDLMRQAATQLRTAAAEGEDRFAEILHRLDSWCQAYPEDVFTPTTHEEIQAVAAAFPGMVDRISASMGRHMVKHMREMADTIRKLTPTDSGAGRDGATHVSVPYETLRYLAYATRGMQICCGQGQQTGPDEIQCCGQPMDAGEELGRLLPDVPRMYGAPSTDDTAIAGAAGES